MRMGWGWGGDCKINEPITIQIGTKERSAKFRIHMEQETMDNINRTRQAYEPEITELFCQWLRPGDNVVDVGANVGWFTVLAASMVGPTGKVFAFEPGPENFQTLKENVELNGHTDIVKLSSAPLSDKNVKQTFYLNPKGHGGHSLWKNDEEATAIEVTTETLDQQELPEKIRILKIDTEGHEQRILEGAARILDSAQAPDFIFAEYHHTGLEKAGDTEFSMRYYMEGHGYLCFILPPCSYLPINLPLQVALLSQYAVNYLFIREEHIKEMPQYIQLGRIEKRETGTSPAPNVP